VGDDRTAETRWFCFAFLINHSLTCQLPAYKAISRRRDLPLWQRKHFFILVITRPTFLPSFHASRYLDLIANANTHPTSFLSFPLCCYQRKGISCSLACSAFAPDSRSRVNSQQSSLLDHAHPSSHILTLTDQNHQLEIHPIRQ
jgi:hypothetical protein